MVKHLLLFFVSLFTFCGAVSASNQVWKENGKCLFVKLADGGMDAYESGKASVSNGKLTVTYNGVTATYAAGTYTGYSNEVPVMPTMTTYKFNNKYNHELFSDVEVAQVSNNMTLNVNQIGHYLTASFNLSDRKAVAYVGTTLQESKVTRQNFEKAVTYTVTYPGYNLVTANGKVPFGNDYTVNVNWLIDNATAVARIDINIEGGVTEITDKMKETYQTATFTLTGNGAFEDMKDVAMQIKGRGNSSWTDNTKKPYRIKFDEKQKPFGLTKGKSWVLLANAQNGSFLTNAIAHKIAAMIGVPYTNHSVPVELYLSGQYKGTYMFTEHRSIGGNSVDIDDETGYLLELDTNDKGDDKADVISADNDDIYFNSSNIELPVVIKDPDLADWATDYGQDAAKQRMTDIKTDFNKLTALLMNKSATADLKSLIDLDIAARYILAYDLSLNNEAGHPKSIFMWKENFWNEDGTTNPNAKMMFGPVWDFDWAFGYGKKGYFGMYSYFDNSRYNATWLTLTSTDLYGGQKGYGRDFFNAILVNNEFKRHYYNVWNEFMKDEAILTELADYIQAYYDYAKPSFNNSVTNKKDSSYDYETQVTTASTWLKNRANYLNGKLTTSNVDDLAFPTVGDTDVNGVLSVRDIAVIGTSNDNDKKADVDGNGTAGNAADKAAAAEIVAAAGYLPPMYYYNKQMVNATLSAGDVNVAPGESVTIPVSLNLNNSTAFLAMQAEIILPQGVTLNGVTKGSGISNKNLLCVEAGEGVYRVVIYGTDANTFGNGVLFNLDVTLATDAVVPGAIMIEDVVAVNSSYSEVRLPDLAIAYDEPAEVILDYYCLNDGVVYDNTVQQKYKKIDYKRNFKNTNWQALYVPFAIDCDAISDKFLLAIIKDENDANVSATSFEIMYAPEGYVTEPNTPYFIKALVAGEHTIVMENDSEGVALYPAEVNSIECGFADGKFVFTGTNAQFTDMYRPDQSRYALSGGALCYASSASVKLGAQRWYLDIVTNGSKPQAAISIRAVDGTTGINEVKTDNGEVKAIFDLTGRRVAEMTVPGIYIVGGKKVLVK